MDGQQVAPYGAKCHPYFGVCAPFPAGDRIGLCASLSQKSRGHSDDILDVTLLCPHGVYVPFQCDEVPLAPYEAVQDVVFVRHFGQYDIATVQFFGTGRDQDDHVAPVI